MKKIILLLLLAVSGIAQTRKGYLVTLQNDTLRGEFWLKKDFYNSIEFRTGREINFNKFEPQSIKNFLIEGEGVFFSKSFNLSGRWFESRLGDVKEDNYQPNIFALTNPKTYQKFLKRHQKNTISLYSAYMEEFGNIFFFENGNAIEMLNNKTADDLKNLYFNDFESEKINQKLNKLPKISNLSYFQELLNLYLSEKGIRKNEDIEPKNKVIIGLKLGGNLNNFKFSQEVFEYRNAHFKPHFSPMIGLSFNINRGRRFSFQPEIQFIQRGTSSDIAGKFVSGEGKNFKYCSKAIEASMNYKYELSTYETKTPFILIGVFGGKVFNDEVTHELYQLNYKNKTTGLISFGGQAGLGLTFNRFQAEIRTNYALTNTTVYLAGYRGIAMQSVQFNLNYEISKK